MGRFQNIATRLWAELRKNSLPSFFRKLVFYGIGRGRFLSALSVTDWQKKRPIARQHFSRFPVGSTDQGRPVIVYIIPGVWIAGGIAVCLRQANMLQEKGYRVFLVTQDFGTEFSWYRDQNVEVVPIQRIEKILNVGIDILIATGWNSVPAVDFLPAKRKLYFVQQDERRFYEDAGRRAFVEETYRQPFEYYTMAHWIRQWLHDEFGHEAAYVPNGLDTSVFHPMTPRYPKGEKLRVLIEGPIDVPFKGVARASAVTQDLDVERWVVSSRGVPDEGWHIDRFFTGVPLDEMPEIYASCDILLKMSTVESFSYTPLEMMACGGASVILRVSGIEEYACHEENCLIVENDVEAKAALRRLIADPSLRRRLADAGQETAKKWSWERSWQALAVLVGK